MKTLSCRKMYIFPVGQFSTPKKVNGHKQRPSKQVELRCLGGADKELQETVQVQPQVSHILAAPINAQGAKNWRFGLELEKGIFVGFHVEVFFQIVWKTDI